MKNLAHFGDTVAPEGEQPEVKTGDEESSESEEEKPIVAATQSQRKIAPAAVAWLGLCPTCRPYNCGRTCERGASNLSLRHYRFAGVIGVTEDEVITDAFLPHIVRITARLHYIAAAGAACVTWGS